MKYFIQKAIFVFIFRVSFTIIGFVTRIFFQNEAISDFLSLLFPAILPICLISRKQNQSEWQ